MNPLKPHRGSHLPLLIKMVQITSGPILEVGSGAFSTPFLHWACFPDKRKIVTIENNPEYFSFANYYHNHGGYHTVICTEDLDSVDISGPWAIAFIDHDPPERRGVEIRRLKDCADYVVVHDTDSDRMKRYGFNADDIDVFRYAWHCKEVRPHTSVFSNKFKLHELRLDHKPPPGLGEFDVISDDYMRWALGTVRPYRRLSICRALSKIYEHTTNEEDRLLLRYASTIARHYIRKVEEYDPQWAFQLCPKYSDIKIAMKEDA